MKNEGGCPTKIRGVFKGKRGGNDKAAAAGLSKKEKNELEKDSLEEKKVKRIENVAPGKERRDFWGVKMQDSSDHRGRPREIGKQREKKSKKELEKRKLRPDRVRTDGK